jgi:asparagine synthase (glutamine-hydrolysing)
MKIIVNDKILQETIRDYLDVQSDMPAGDPNTILLFHLSKQMKKKGLKVLMVGEGGDELGGYPIYTRLLKEYKLLSRYKNLTGILNGGFSEKIKHLLDCIYKGKIISRRQIHGFYEIDKASFWMGRKVYNSYDVLLKYMDEIRDDLDDSFLRKVLNIEYKLRLPELILSRIDYPTMASSVEARSPYMDHKLIEFSSSLDFNIKMKNGAKSLIKDIARDKLPDYLLHHSKVGFGMLLKPFFTTSLPHWYHKELLENKAPLEQYISREFLSQLLRQNRNGSKGSKLWLLYSLNKWLEKNIIQS